ncbi:phage GP46 family protein, partial [Pseudomonas protegens]|uniref:phage GP46 family protein n=2 Tax=Pseudomonas TaxID=286 RepID=UPI0015E0C2A6
KLTRETQLDAEFYAREALQWLLDDGEVIRIEIRSERATDSRLNLGVILTISTGERLEIHPTELWQVIYAV